MHRLNAAAIGLVAAIALVFAIGPRPGTAQAPAAGPKPAEGLEIATFAGGCFWCVESDFDKLEGVTATVSGYMGGKTANPTYKQVTAGGTGHLEVVQVTFDPKKVSYQKLVDHFWRTIDPYDAGGQFCDRGESYTTALFTHSPEQRRVAEASKAELAKGGPLKQPIATTVRDAAAFTVAEEYHQDYYQKNPLQYRWYRSGCRRDARLAEIWGKKAGH
jgi:peptide-methionine (S)-S-oxide reductase